MQRGYESLRQGLIGAWCPSSQPGGALLIDRSGYNAHPSLTGFSWAGVNNGAAINGNGTSARASVGDLPRFRLTTTTITGWIGLAAQGAAARCIFATYSQNTAVAGITLGINIGTTSQNALSVVIGKNTGTNGFGGDFGIWTTTINVCDSVLRSFACVITPTTAQFYVDGAAIATSLTFGVAVAAAYAAANFVNIGAEQTASASLGKYWPGILDDVRVYNRALTNAEIRLLASRRSIGLVPQRQRRTSASSKRLYLQVGGTWKETVPYVNLGGTWKEASVYRNDGTGFKN